MTTMRDTGDDVVQSVVRALHILEVVREWPGLQVKGVARRAGLNISTTYRLIHTLEHKSYVERADDGGYRATPNSRLRLPAP
jgi:DNA-binding IclR family transcriptional regulator